MSDECLALPRRVRGLRAIDRLARRASSPPCFQHAVGIHSFIRRRRLVAARRHAGWCGQITYLLDQYMPTQTATAAASAAAAEAVEPSSAQPASPKTEAAAEGVQMEQRAAAAAAPGIRPPPRDTIHEDELVDTGAVRARVLLRAFVCLVFYIYKYIHLYISIYLYIHRYRYICIYVSISVSIYRSIYLPTYLSIYLSIYSYIHR